MVRNEHPSKILLLGDLQNIARYHPVDEVTSGVQKSLQPLGVITLRTDYQSFRPSDLESYDLVINYIDRYDLVGEFSYTLVDFIQQGGRVLNLHNGILVSNSNTKLESLFGGVFVKHPPYGTLTCKIDFKVPWLTGCHDFEIEEEAYIVQEKGDLSRRIYLYYIYQGQKIAAGWIIDDPSCKCAYLALGHDRKTFENIEALAVLRYVAAHMLES